MSYGSDAGPSMMTDPVSPLAYCDEKCEWYQLVPYCSAFHRYVLVPPGRIGHSVMPLTPSLMLFLYCRIPCQCSAVLSRGLA